MFKNKSKTLNIVKTLLIIIIFSSCDRFIPRYKTREREVKIFKKYSEIESTNSLGAFRTNRYFLYTNGELENVELELYISCEVGDTLTKTERYRVK